ncbi:Palmitoyl-protein_thioesterase [Hexamita inflata]|uniref:palmitoyl-CoA hydrolase n=2 Tax=Hexamita inflata TaxID=28002 RepID=A0AA86QU61_9EUKA|nr:Palmitoyl-protein thioesterase [Hexamita inflata]
MILFLNIITKQPPVVVMHGIMDTKESMNNIIQYLKDITPDLYVLNCEVGNGYMDSIFMDVYSAVKEVTNCIVNDPNLKDGFIILGYSQGGYLLRSYLENRTDSQPKVLRFITLTSPLAGYFCGVKSACAMIPGLPDFVNDLIADFEYTDFVQNLITGAGYWRNPYQLPAYLNYQTHLSLLDNQAVFNQQYKKNFLEPDKFILFASENDGVISPWQSAWFGFFENENDAVVQKMEERDIYQEDLFGLKTLNEQGRIVRIRSGLDHFSYLKDEAFIKEQVAPWVKMDV